MSAFGLAVAGALLLWVPAFRFRIDSAVCAAWPTPAVAALYGAAHVAAVALLAAGWLAADRARFSLRRALTLGAIVHAVAAVAPPFASNDPLFYAAIGRVMARGYPAWTPLAQALPPGDALLALLPEGWRAGTSPYGALFDQLTLAIARLAGDHLLLTLRLYQLGNLGVLVASAALTGRALGARAATLLLFCPLAIVDGTVNPHNDALLALAVAAFVLASVRGRPVAAVAALAVTPLIKLSGALLLGWELGRRLLRPLVQRLRPSTIVTAAAALVALALAAVVVLLARHPELHAFAALVGEPGDVTPHITRSVEALPRAYLSYVAHAPRASWLVGLFFRAAAALWIVYCAVRAAQLGDGAGPLAWAAIALFAYYLFVHAFLQSWYLLPLLPLATQLPAWMQGGMRAFMISLTAYYALHLPLDCDLRPPVLAVKEVLEAMIVILPCWITLLAGRRTANRASAAASPPGA